MTRIRTIQWISASLCCLIFSCKSAPRHAEVIPEDANVVSSIRAGQIFEKADLEKVSQLESLMEVLRNNMDDELRDLFDQMLEDPSVSGIDFSEPIYYFTYSQGKKSGDEYKAYSAFSFGIGKREKFQELMDQLFSDATFEEEEDYTWCYTDGASEYSSLVAFGDDFGVLLSPSGWKMTAEDNQRELENIMTLESESSLMETTENFSDFLGNTADIAYWMNTEIYVDMLDRDLEDVESALKLLNVDFPFDRADLEQNYFTGEINFDDGEISMVAQIAFSEALGNLYSELEGDNLNTKHLGLIPGEQLFGLYAISVNMDGVKAKIDEWEFGDLLDEATSAALGLDYAQVLDMLDGTGWMGMSGQVETKIRSYSGEARTEKWPGMYVGFGIADDEALKTFLDEFQSREIPGLKLEEMDDIYELEIDRSVFYLGTNDELLVISNDDNWVKDVVAGEVEEGLSGDVTGCFDGVPAGAYLNLKLDDWPEDYSSAVFSFIAYFGLGDKTKGEAFMELFDHFQMKGSFQKNELLLDFAKDDENSLFAVLQMIDGNMD